MSSSMSKALAHERRPASFEAMQCVADIGEREVEAGADHPEGPVDRGRVPRDQNALESDFRIDEWWLGRRGTTLRAR